ncbi:MAG: hypothetical protein NTY53_12210 [Kiritimatiellaeota bacterium]|nr:hypothetical protein [Kiritimatiellota bacterium]
MKTTVYRPLHRTAAVPHFVALLGVLHEAAVRGLALLSDAPAPRRFPSLGKTHRRLFRGLETVAAGARH